jgi:hypothetical protein
VQLPLDPPVVVLGDASYSMDVAIRTATVIGSLLTALTNAELRFFNVQSIPPHVVPRTIEQVLLSLSLSLSLSFLWILLECFCCRDGVMITSQVLEVATKTRADGLTAPACTLVEYYRQRKVV